MTWHDALKEARGSQQEHTLSYPFERGETVYRRMPKIVRPAKHLMAEPSSGPYLVDCQRSLSSIVLRGPATNELVDGGIDIPLDQILAGPLPELG